LNIGVPVRPPGRPVRHSYGIADLIGSLAQPYALLTV
jgi:hypothetical protein